MHLAFYLIFLAHEPLKLCLINCCPADKSQLDIEAVPVTFEM